MPSPATQLQQIREFPDLLRYLEDELDWPLEEYGFDDLTFAYEPAELGLKDDDAAKVKTIHQLRPLRHEQPWGVFFVEFEQKKLPVVVLRRILSHLVVKKRAAANAADARRWASRDLLFVSAFGDPATADREIAFAHFHESPGDLPTLRVLGWDGGNTALTLASVARDLREKLRWPGDDESPDAWRQRWGSAFRHRIGHRIRTADSLAETLAALARGIRDKARTMLAAESERGKLTKLFRAFQTALIHDLTPDNFADTYAQTITYGLLTAAISRTDMTGGAAGTVVLAEDMAGIVPITNPFLKEMLQTFLKVGGRRGGIDFDELGIQDVVELLRGDETDLPAVIRDFGHKNPEKDPVIHFYEHFLSAYDHDQKVKRGVFYTPPAVVSYIVRSVHELLITEFGLADGLADTATWGEMQARIPGLKRPTVRVRKEGDSLGQEREIPADTAFVQVLDPATGTATFLVEVIEVIHRTLTARWQREGRDEAQRQDAWNEYVPKHLLPRLHGYELMMAPYAVAHMKIGLKLNETGYRFCTEERARVYLTNALEPATEVSDELEALSPALAHEARDVNEIKRKGRFIVIVGNPPYSDASQNMGSYVAPLIEPFRFFRGERIKERGAIRFEHCINNDYVKFWGLTLSSATKVTCCVISLITSSSFIAGKSFRGVRDAMLNAADHIAILDLHGEGWAGGLARRGIADENVFDITTGVAVTLLFKSVREKHGSEVNYSELVGSFEDKAITLRKAAGVPPGIAIKLDPRHYSPFTPGTETDSEEYWEYPQVDKFFGASVDGIKTSRDGLVIANTREQCRSKILDFSASVSSIEELEQAFQISARGFDIRKAQEHLRRHFNDALVLPILYRPFDLRYIYYDQELVLSHRMNTMPCILHSDAWAIVFASRLSSKGFDHAIATNALCAHKCASHDINSRMFPVVGIFSPLLGKPSLMSNLSNLATSKFPLSNAPDYESATKIGAYLYAVVNAPSYKLRYYEDISQDFPRVPTTHNSTLFDSLSSLGEKLVKLHTMVEIPPADELIYSGPLNDVISSPSWSANVLRIGITSTLSGVPEDVWRFKMCGYDVCKSWFSAGRKAGIKREGERFTQETLLQLRTMLWSIKETLRLRGEIDEVIENHGGWPGAFQTPNGETPA